MNSRATRSATSPCADSHDRTLAGSLLTEPSDHRVLTADGGVYV
jgi:hypothetical protein